MEKRESSTKHEKTKVIEMDDEVGLPIYEFEETIRKQLDSYVCIEGGKENFNMSEAENGKTIRLHESQLPIARR